MNRLDTLVVGGGPAGITFSRTLKKLKPEMRIAMLRPEPHSMVYCAIPYAIEGLFNPAKVFKKDELVTDAGVQLVHRRAAEVDLKARRVVDDQGETHEAETLFLATGASPIRPPIPGADAKNVHTVKTQHDMEALIGHVREGARRAVVVGAGAIGIEQAQAYRERGLETWLVDMAPRVLPAMLDDDMADPVHTALRERGIHLLLSARVASIEKEGDCAASVMLEDGTIIELDPERDFVCFAVGMKPDIELFMDQGLEIARDGIMVDSRMRTNLPGVLAAGDCCSYISLIDEKPIGGKLATNAVPMAKVAARALAGKDDEYPGFVNGAATCAYHLRIGATGFGEELARQRGIDAVAGWGETTALFPMMPGAGKLRVKVVADTRNLRIIGGQVVSTLPTADKVDLLTLAIQQRLTLKQLAKLSYSAQPWQSFFPARSAVVEACENALDNFAKRREAVDYPAPPRRV